MKETLSQILLALKKSREELVSISINEEPRLFSCFFQYEKNENLLSLSFEREHSIFINSCLEKISETVIDVENEYAKKSIKHIMLELIKLKSSRTSSLMDAFFIDDKIKNIEEILFCYNKDINRLEKINYIMKKEQVLFDRKFNELLGD